MPKQSAPPDNPVIPLTVEAFAGVAGPLLGHAPFAVAVSGGADSVALMCLAAEWRRNTGHAPPLVITVDHSLREGSAAEARQVGHWAASLGLEHLTLTWDGRALHGNLQAEARRARYAQLAGALEARAIRFLATGHNRDDQAETVMIRLARGSGLAGLSGMSTLAAFPGRRQRDMWLARPLLDIPHARLVATLRARGQSWIEDPSNANPRFLRARLREAMPVLASLGLSPERLAATAAHLARASTAIDGLADGMWRGVVQADPCGYVLLQTPGLAHASDEVALRLVARVLRTVSGEAYAPRFDRLSAALDWLRASQPATGRTLGGCRLFRRNAETVLVAREESAMQRAAHVLRLAPGGSGVWDGRFAVVIPQGAPKAEYEVSPLGPDGLKVLGKQARLPRHEPRRIAATCPAVWCAGRLRAAPTLGFDTGIGATAAFLEA